MTLPFHLFLFNLGAILMRLKIALLNLSDISLDSKKLDLKFCFVLLNVQLSLENFTFLGCQTPLSQPMIVGPDGSVPNVVEVDSYSLQHSVDELFFIWVDSHHQPFSQTEKGFIQLSLLTVNHGLIAKAVRGELQQFWFEGKIFRASQVIDSLFRTDRELNFSWQGVEEETNSFVQEYFVFFSKLSQGRPQERQRRPSPHCSFQLLPFFFCFLALTVFKVVLKKVF